MVKYDALEDCLYIRQKFKFLDVKVDITSESICIIGQFIYGDEKVNIIFDPLIWNEYAFDFPKYSDVEIIFALTVHDETLINYPIGLQAI